MKSRNLLACVLFLGVATLAFPATDAETVRIVQKYSPVRVSAAVTLQRSATGARATIVSGTIEAFHTRPLALATAAEVKLRREKLGLTQAQLAARGELEPDFVAMAESANKEPSLADVFNLANALQVSVQDLVTGIAARDAVIVRQPVTHICAVSAFIGNYAKDHPDAYWGWMPITQTADMPLPLSLYAGQPAVLPSGITMEFPAHGVFTGEYGSIPWLGLMFSVVIDGSCQRAFRAHKEGLPW